jgi:hypothetical protein
MIFERCDRFQKQGSIVDQRKTGVARERSSFYSELDFRGQLRGIKAA